MDKFCTQEQDEHTETGKSAKNQLPQKLQNRLNRSTLRSTDTPWSLLAKQRVAAYEENRRYYSQSNADEGDHVRSNEEIEEESWVEWQQRWDSAQTGRWTHQSIPRVREQCEREFGDLTYYTTQVLAGHGNFRVTSRGWEKYHQGHASTARKESMMT